MTINAFKMSNKREFNEKARSLVNLGYTKIRETANWNDYIKFSHERGEESIRLVRGWKQQ